MKKPNTRRPKLGLSLIHIYARQYEAAPSDENTARLENIAELRGAVPDFERLNPEGGMTDVLENVALMTDLDGMEEQRGAVTLMTLHAAKGLEFDAVFLAGMEENIFPIWQIRNTSILTMPH